jgi:hypothetical protein
MGKPDWMTKHEYDDEQRRAYNELQYKAYHAPAWVDKAGQIVASVVLLAIVAVVVAGLVYLAAKILGSI